MSTTTNLIAVWTGNQFAGVVAADADLAEMAKEAGVSITKTAPCAMCSLRSEIPAGAVILGTASDCDADSLDDGCGHRGTIAYAI